MADGWTRVRRYVQFSYILAIATLSLACVTVYSLVSPFNPMSVSDVVLEPGTVCPSELVGVGGKTDLASGKYHLTIDPLWIDIDGSKKYLDEAQVDGDVQGPIKDVDPEEELVYVSPPERGEWIIRFEIDVEGRNLILPRKQHLEVTSTNTLHVVDCGDTYTYDDFTNED